MKCEDRKLLGELLKERSRVYGEMQRLSKENVKLRDCIKSVVLEWRRSTLDKPGAIIRHAEDLFTRLKREVEP